MESSGTTSGSHEIGPGDCFVTGFAAKLRSARRTRYRAIEDTFCLELDGEGMNKLVKTSAEFRRFHDRLHSDDMRYRP